MNKNFKFSIIVPFYNSKDTILNTIDSLNKQDYKEFEVVFVNDGSNDNTIELIENEKIEFEYKIINKENSGVSESRNMGIRFSNGEYILFLDSDDCINKRLFHDLNKIISEYSNDLILFQYKMINNLKQYYIEDENYENYEVLNQIEEKDSKTIILKYLKKDLNIHICSILFKKNFLIENNLKFNKGFFYGEDINFFLKSLINIDRVIYIKRVYFYYLNNPYSQMKKFNNKRFTGLNAIKDIINYYEEKGMDNEIIIAIKNRYIEEIIYICMNYALYCNDKKLSNILKIIIKDNKNILKEYKVYSKKDKTILRDIYILKYGLKIYRMYYRIYSFILKNTRKSCKVMKGFFYGQKYKK